MVSTDYARYPEHDPDSITYSQNCAEEKRVG